MFFSLHMHSSEVLLFYLLSFSKRLYYHNSSINPPSLKPPFPSPYYSSLINDGLCSSITTLKLRVDWSGMVYLPTGSSDLFLVLGCMTFKFLYSNASTFYDSYLRKTDTKISPSPNSLKWFKINKPLTSFQVRGKTLLFIYHLEPLI